jgi:hypothetical protein
MAQVEIDTTLPVPDDSGKPVHFGWARSPVFAYNKTLIQPPYGRINESDRYIMFSPTHMIFFELLDGGYLGYIGISIVSLKDKKRSTQTFIVPFSLGNFYMPQSAETGSARVERKKNIIDFTAMEGGARIVKVDIPHFGHHRNLRGVVVLTPPSGAEPIVTCMSWRGEKNAFRYSLRAPWYTVEGVMQFGSSELVFTKDNAWGIFDWNRGVRPRSDIRFWAAACGLSGGRRVSFNVGYGSADSSQGTENAFFVDGKLHKLDQVTFHISPSNWIEPWRFTSNDKRLEMVFTPDQERIDTRNMFFHSLKLWQLCGSFSGKVVLDDGEEMEFQNITGFAERRRTRF